MSVNSHTLEPEHQQANGEALAADTRDVLDLLIVLAKHKRWMAGIIGGFVIAGVVLALLLPKMYTAETKILAPQRNPSVALMMGQGGQIAGLLGQAEVGNALGLSDPNAIFLTMLKSRTIADRLISRFGLMKLYNAKLPSDARLKLQKSTNITDGKDNIITIEFTDRSPQRASDMANAYVEELRRLNQDLGVSEASQRRMFFDRELEQAKQSLAQSEIAFKQAQQKTGIIELQGQARGIITAAADLQAQIAAIEVEMKGMETFATPENPDLLRARQQRAELQSQLAKLESSQGPRTSGDIMVPTGKVPEAGLEYVRALRELKYYETLYELLAKQDEAAKLDEAKEAVTIEVLDVATPPDRRSSPKRTLIVVMFAILGSFVAVIIAFFRETALRMRSDPEASSKLNLLKIYLGWRSRSRIQFHPGQ